MTNISNTKTIVYQKMLDLAAMNPDKPVLFEAGGDFTTYSDFIRR